MKVQEETIVAMTASVPDHRIKKTPKTWFSDREEVYELVYLRIGIRNLMRRTGLKNNHVEKKIFPLVPRYAKTRRETYRKNRERHLQLEIVQIHLL